jgi:hypothetical protein
MRSSFIAALCCAGLLAGTANDLRAQPQKKPNLYGPITKLIPATDAEKDKGIVAWVVVKGSDLRVQLSGKSQVQIQTGKLVNPGKAADVKEGDLVSIWHGDVADSDPPQTTADFVIIFRPGKSDLPPTPGKQ